MITLRGQLQLYCCYVSGALNPSACTMTLMTLSKTIYIYIYIFGEITLKMLVELVHNYPFKRVWTNMAKISQYSLP